MCAGWTNTPTLLAYSWLTAGAEECDAMVELVQGNALDNGDLAEALKQWANDRWIGEDTPSTGLAADLLTHAASEVNWHEIAKHIHEEHHGDA